MSRCSPCASRTSCAPLDPRELEGARELRLGEEDKAKLEKLLIALDAVRAVM